MSVGWGYLLGASWHCCTVSTHSRANFLKRIEIQLKSLLKCMEHALSLLWHVRSFSSVLTCDLVAACIVAECVTVFSTVFWHCYTVGSWAGLCVLSLCCPSVKCDTFVGPSHRLFSRNCWCMEILLLSCTGNKQCCTQFSYITVL